jgi:hypothetical protein
MKIYIPTRGRPFNQETLKHFPQEMKKQVVLVIDEDEKDEYHWCPNTPKMIIPANIKGIGPKRKYIVENTDDPRIVMLDDDLRFYIRKSPTDWHLRYLESEEYPALFGLLDEWMDQGYAHCGVSAREGNNRIEALRVENTRYMRVLAYNLDAFPKDVVWGRTRIMEDFDMALQLLRRGKACSVSYYYAQGQKSSNASGGCSEWRTMEVQSEGAERLAALHPTCVKVVEKSTKTAWEGQTRKDVRVGWKKAYKEGLENASN